MGMAISRRPDEPTFTVTRGLIAAALALLGFAVLVEDWPNRSRAFMQRHPADDFAFHVAAMLVASLIADLLWMLWRFLRWRTGSRRDLLVHHFLAMPAFAYAFAHRVGFALIAIAATTELLTACSGVINAGTLTARPALQVWGRRGAYAVLVVWRIPFWLALAVVSLRILIDPVARAGFAVEYAILFATTLLLLALDVYWVVELNGEQRDAERGVRESAALTFRANEESR